jgi:hypothetical protein
MYKITMAGGGLTFEKEVGAEKVAEVVRFLLLLEAAEAPVKPAVKVEEEQTGPCRECKKPKRHAKWCSSFVPKAAKTPAGQNGRRTVTCKKCGEQGHTQKTCKSDAVPAAPTPAAGGKVVHDLDKRELLTEAEYNSVREEHLDDGKPLGQILWSYRKNGIDEMRKAIANATYAEYKK